MGPGEKDSVSAWERGCLYDNLAKNLTPSCSYSEFLGEAGLRDDGLMYSAEDSSRQESVLVSSEKATHGREASCPTLGH